MPLGIAAPAAISVEIRSSERRVFRLSRALGEGGIELVLPAPFEPGSPVSVRFTLPDGEEMKMHARVEVRGDPAEDEGANGGATLYFLDASPEKRAALLKYVLPRLGFPAT